MRISRVGEFIPASPGDRQQWFMMYSQHLVNKILIWGMAESVIKWQWKGLIRNIVIINTTNKTVL